MAEWKKFVSNNKLDIGLTTLGVALDIASGKGVVKSVGKGLVDYAVWDTIGALVGGPAMGAIVLGQVAGAVGGMVIENGRVKADKVNKASPGYGKIGSGFMDTEQAFTMRQRSLQAMGGNQGLINSTLGGEARRRASSIRY